LFKASPTPMASVEQARPVAPVNPPQIAPQVAPLQDELSQSRPQGTATAVPSTPGHVPVPTIVPLAQQPAIEPPHSPQTIARDRRSAYKPQRAANTHIAKRKAHQRQRPHNGDIWSSEANALVSTTSTSETDANAASSPPNSPPQEPTRFRRPNPFARNERTPSRPHESTIAPATTGAPTAERPAPNSDDVDPFRR
jgi:hypothetical protein